VFETTAIISRRHPITRVSLTSLPVSAGLHLLGGLAIVSTQLINLSFPLHPPAQPRPYVLSGLNSVPPPPPAPRARPAVTKVTPAGTTTPSVSEVFAPTEIPEEIVTEILMPLGARTFAEIVPAEQQGASDGQSGGVVGGGSGGVFGGVVGGFAAPARKPGEPVLIARDARLPLHPLSQVYPEYPEEARLRGMEGSVLVRYIIDKAGRVREVTILRHAYSPLFDKSVVKAIRGWRFYPMIEQGSPVEVIHELTVNYVLIPMG